MYDERDVDRFWSKVDQGDSEECWPWIGSKLKARGNYGQINIKYKILYAHRVAWEIENGPIPSGFLICHTCHNPPCCNPAHLYAGTYGDNGHDAAVRGLIGKWDRRGTKNPQSKLTENDVRNIRERLASGETKEQIAKSYNVNPPAIYQIERGKNWGWLK